MTAEALKLVEEPKLLKLDLGCGKNSMPGFWGVDIRHFDGVKFVCDLSEPWTLWADDSVDEVFSSHFLEHLKPAGRINFANELFRVLKPGGKAALVTPHWAASRAYGDLTHEWPPVSEWWFLYLQKDWREANAPHNDFYTCDFDVVTGSGMAPHLLSRNDEYRSYAMQNYKEAIFDLHVTLFPRKGVKK
jgi:predicted SAM-dependent methyltransferase